MTIGYRKTCKTEWISPDIWRIIEEMEQLTKKALDSRSHSLSEEDKQVKKSARRDKRQYVERLATEAEAASERRDMKTVYQIIPKLRGDRGQNQDLTVPSLGKR